MRLFDFFDKQADAKPDAAAVIYDGELSIYRDIQAQSRRIARALMATDLHHGAKIASWIPNHPSFFAVQIEFTARRSFGCRSIPAPLHPNVQRTCKRLARNGSLLMLNLVGTSRSFGPLFQRCEVLLH